MRKRCLGTETQKLDLCLLKIRRLRTYEKVSKYLTVHNLARALGLSHTKLGLFDFFIFFICEIP